MAKKYRDVVQFPHNLFMLVAVDEGANPVGEVELLSVAFVHGSQFKTLTPEQENELFQKLLGVPIPKVE